jgi:hypothetical protein
MPSRKGFYSSPVLIRSCVARNHYGVKTLALVSQIASKETGAGIFLCLHSTEGHQILIATIQAHSLGCLRIIYVEDYSMKELS